MMIQKMHSRKYAKSPAHAKRIKELPRREKEIFLHVEGRICGKKNPKFLHPPMAGPRGACGMGASGPVGTRPETAESCDNLARSSNEPGLKWCHPVLQLCQLFLSRLEYCSFFLGRVGDTRHV